MSTGMEMPGQTAPHLASSIDTDVYWHALRRAQQSVKSYEKSLQKRPQLDSAFRPRELRACGSLAPLQEEQTHP